MESRFTGTLLGQIGIGILSCIIMMLTFGLGTPWAICLSEGWYAKHTIIDGEQLVFDGKGHQLFGNYIKWFFLTIITFGIYSFWLSIKMKQWTVSHTHHVDRDVEAYEPANTGFAANNTPAEPKDEEAAPMSFGDKINAFAQSQSEEAPIATKNTYEDNTPAEEETYSSAVHADEVAENNYQPSFNPTYEDNTQTYDEPATTNEPEAHYDANGDTYYLDENGNPYYIDETGNPYYVDEEGNPFYVDENGRPFVIDENGNAYYIDE
ncbi:MAG: DUF898 family protein [Clostridia bacterium]|nr:DUF898 family protein [Clostridia bacterium]